MSSYRFAIIRPVEPGLPNQETLYGDIPQKRVIGESLAQILSGHSTEEALDAVTAMAHD
jgi:hypothetical protein